MRTLSEHRRRTFRPLAVPAPDVLDLSVIIVNYNVREFLEQALRSVQRASAGLEVEVFVVDNNSVDGSVEAVRTQFPDVHLIANDRNVGFGAANNQAIRHARGRYLLILNPDTLVQEDTFNTMLGFMEAHPEAGALGCRILNPDGTFAPESRRTFPTPSVAFYRMTGLSRLFPRSRTFGRYNMTYLSPDEEAEVDALSGSCMLVRRAALFCRMEEWKDARANVGPHLLAPSSPSLHTGNGAGLFDEDFFMYGEDLDWCYRIQQAGWKIYYTPETQIIHYKGESTKKGELRYVRHFYGAMLQFTEKHFEGRYSRLLAWILRAGIVGRAALCVLSRMLRRLARPALDFVLVAAVVACLGLGYGLLNNLHMTPRFFATVVPGFALGSVCGIALAGGYRRHRHTRLRPVWVGALAGLLLMAAVSFFVKDIAFSRAIVGLSGPAAALLLSIQRLIQRARQHGPRQALLVGSAHEAQRLQHMLKGHPQPPLHLIGYVTVGAPPSEPLPHLPHLGALHHLRDLVRLRHIDEVVFAADGLSNYLLFQLVQQLRDLPVRFAILAEGRSHVIGKASIEDLSTPALVEADETVGELRSTLARRAFEVPVALLGLTLHPLLWLLAKANGAPSFFGRLAARTRQLPQVLRGRRALVGYDPAGPFRPPPEWALRPGVFAVTDTLAASTFDAQRASQAYWFYITHQSAALDGDIIIHAIRNIMRNM